MARYVNAKPFIHKPINSHTYHKLFTLSWSDPSLQLHNYFKMSHKTTNDKFKEVILEKSPIPAPIAVKVPT